MNTYQVTHSNQTFTLTTKRTNIKGMFVVTEPGQAPYACSFISDRTNVDRAVRDILSCRPAGTTCAPCYC